MVLLQFAVVVMRYVFGVGFIFMQEGVIYLHAALFMLGAGYTLLHGGHVRVDIFYRDAAPPRKALIDLLGVILFLVPVCGICGPIGFVGFTGMLCGWLALNLFPPSRNRRRRR